MFTKILIANRGEIAIRVMRACRELGVQTVAVYSEIDRMARHVGLADEAYLIGPAPSSQSYLDIDSILDVAARSGAQAIHPGYGFLAENAEFARQVREANLAFIGPPAETIELLGDKMAARKRMIESGVRVVPGTQEKIESIDGAEAYSKQVGYPVLIKAAAGGGGKGMRIVHSKSQLAEAIRGARSEAEAAFADGRIYIEKYLEKPRHVEIQILADSHGNVIHLGERECSIQRRHQKVIEESPSPIVAEKMRQDMGRAAVAAARAAGYVNAGTVEFLVDADRNFYFLEVNTRLQVEHPVTELVTGVDLAKEQIKIAAGERLSFRQEDIVWKGAAIECRIYAEDPENNFLPSTGTIRTYREPSGPGVRVDSGLFEGEQVSVYYDPLIAKLLTWGVDRNEAIQRMKRALDEYKISGLRTTISFHRAVMENERFLRGELSTHFIEEEFGRRELPPLRDHDIVLRAMAAFSCVLDYQSKNSRASLRTSTAKSVSPWKLSGRPKSSL